MIKKTVFLSVLSFAIMLPAVGLAFNPPIAPGTVNIFNAFGNILDAIFMVLWAVAVAFIVFMFVLAGFKFLTAQGNIEKVKEARNAVLWGIVGTAVVLLAWSAIVTIRSILNV